MASVMVGASTGAMKSVIGKLTSLLGEEYKLIKGVKRGVSFLIDELSSMNAALERLADMEDQIMDVQTREWRDKVRDMSYDIEDCIDRFLQRHSLVNAAKANFVRKAVRNLKKLWEDRQIGKEIKELKALVKEESERRSRYEIDRCFVNTTTVPLDPRVPEYHQAARGLVGMDGPREKITRWLVDEEKQPKVVAIYGIGGSGKTTLAAEVYHKIEQPFDCRAFVSVSRTPDITRLLKDMLFQLDSKKHKESGMWEQEQLTSLVMECLQDKRYLIVIGDIWNTLAWEHVRSALPINDKRSRIIVTTRSKDVARSCSTDFDGHMYEESLLSEEHFRILFFRRILGPSEDLPQELTEVSTEILKKCGGLPLAIISIASLLANKSRTVQVWVKIRNSISSAVEKDSSVDRMKSILFLSYFDLPPYLKTCLLYLSVFPEDYYIDCRFLIWRWVAEGLITGVSREDMEFTGESYLNELINRSLIQPRKIGADGTTVKFCGVHDIILDFIISQAVKDNFVTISNGNNASQQYSSNKIRRLSLQLNFPEAADLPRDVDVSHRRSLHKLNFPEAADLTRDVDVSHLRSLHKFGMSSLRQVPRDCECSRVLNIEGVWGLQNCHIEHIASFSQLKYLRIVGDVSPRSHIKYKEKKRAVKWYVEPKLASTGKLPELMGNLQHLEVLDLRGILHGKLPASIVQLHKLVRLFVDKSMVLPDGIGNLECLEELSKINLCEVSIRFIQELGELTKLRVLKIGWSYIYRCDDKESREKVWSASLTKLVAKTLRSLHFTKFKSSDFIDSWVFTSVSCPPLRRLVLAGISNFGFPTIPSEIRSLTNLTRLSISRACEMGEEGVKILSSLPALLSLTLMLGYRVRESHVIGSQGFQRLVKLHFMGEKSLTFEAGAMPKLQRLILVLTDVPQYKPGGLVEGLLHLSNLRHVSIRIFCLTVDYTVRDVASQIRSVASTHPNRPIVKTDVPGYQGAKRDIDDGADSEMPQAIPATPCNINLL